MIQNFISNHRVEVVLYKGGTIEKDICEKLSVQSYNIEVINGLKKIYSHDPATEVNLYWDQLYKLSIDFLEK